VPVWTTAGEGGKLSTGPKTAHADRSIKQENAMPTNHEQDTTAASLPGNALSTGNGANSTPPTVAEYERLRKRVAELEAECSGYQRALTTMLREQLAETDTTTDSDLDRMAEEALRLGSFDDELRQLLQQT
jgi:hypothetical protein